MNKKRMFLVFLGGTLGGLCRFSIDTILQYFDSFFMISTIIVNLVGPFLLGLVYTRFNNTLYASIFITGFLGSFTTFSTLTVHLTMTLEYNVLSFYIYLLCAMTFGFVMFLIGIKVQQLVGERHV